MGGVKNVCVRGKDHIWVDLYGRLLGFRGRISQNHHSDSALWSFVFGGQDQSVLLTFHLTSRNQVNFHKRSRICHL